MKLVKDDYIGIAIVLGVMIVMSIPNALRLGFWYGVMTFGLIVMGTTTCMLIMRR